MRIHISYACTNCKIYHGTNENTELYNLLSATELKNLVSFDEYHVIVAAIQQYEKMSFLIDQLYSF